MDTIANNFIIYISTITASLSYCYFFSSKIPKGIYRFISLIPIFYVFTVLPLRCSAVFTTAVAFSFTTWLTNFKLLRFAFDLDQSPFRSSDSLLRFITFTSLPIKSEKTHSNSPPDRFWFRLGFQALIFSIIVKIVVNHNLQFHPNMKNMKRNVSEGRMAESQWIVAAMLVVYSALLFLAIDVVTAVINAVLLLLTGLELEPSSDQPYLATSLQNFWGRWNLMVTNTLRHTVYKPVRSTFSNYKWAPLAGVFASFVVSGLMHELFVYQLSRERPTWEMTWFFVVHGICVVVEMIVKRIYGGGGGLRWPEFVGWLLTMGFMAATGMWWFFPPLVRRRLDVKILEEYTLVVNFIKSKVFDFNSIIIQIL